MAKKKQKDFIIYSIGSDIHPAPLSQLKEFYIKLKECEKTGDFPSVGNNVEILRFNPKEDQVVFGLGTDSYPASKSDILDFDKMLAKAIKNGENFVVCGHGVQLLIKN